MTLLVEDWAYPVVMSDLDPNDPIVNTASEYMFQMATIGYHILHGTQTVVLIEDAEYEGETIAAGTYEVPVDGRYWTGFNRLHPLDGPARSQAWSGTAHGLFAELGVGTVTHSTLQLGLALAGTLAAIGLTVILAGLGLEVDRVGRWLPAKTAMAFSVEFTGVVVFGQAREAVASALDVLDNVLLPYRLDPGLDLDVEAEAPVLDVVEVVLHARLHLLLCVGGTPPTVHLRPTGNPGPNKMSFTIIWDRFRKLLNKLWTLWSGANKTHIPF